MSDDQWRHLVQPGERRTEQRQIAEFSYSQESCFTCFRASCDMIGSPGTVPRRRRARAERVKLRTIYAWPRCRNVCRVNEPTSGLAAPSSRGAPVRAAASRALRASSTTAGRSTRPPHTIARRGRAALTAWSKRSEAVRRDGCAFQCPGRTGNFAESHRRMPGISSFVGLVSSQ